MTLCIAAIAEDGKSIIGVADTRVALGYTSGESLIKASRVSPKWVAMFAGDDISRCEPIFESVKRGVWKKANVTRTDVERGMSH